MNTHCFKLEWTAEDSIPICTTFISTLLAGAWVRVTYLVSYMLLFIKHILDQQQWVEWYLLQTEWTPNQCAKNSYDAINQTLMAENELASDWCWSISIRTFCFLVHHLVKYADIWFLVGPIIYSMAAQLNLVAISSSYISVQSVFPSIFGHAWKK